MMYEGPTSPLSIRVSIALATLLLSSLASATTYTLTANVTFDNASANVIPGLEAAVGSLIPDGSVLHYVFDFDDAVADADLDPELGLYEESITGQSLNIGAYDFSAIPTPCLLAGVDCSVTVRSNTLFASYFLLSDIRSSTTLGSQLVADLGLVLPQFNVASVSSSIGLGANQVGPFTSGDSIQPPDALSLEGGVSLFIAPASVFSTDSHPVRIEYELANVTVLAGNIAIPLPATLWLLLPAVAAMRAINRECEV